MNIKTKFSGNKIAIIAYIPFLGFLIALIINIKKKNAFTLFHLRQSLGLIISTLLILGVTKIPVFGTLFSYLLFSMLLYLWFSGILNALNYKRKPLPIIGKNVHQLFKPL